MPTLDPLLRFLVRYLPPQRFLPPFPGVDDDRCSWFERLAQAAGHRRPKHAIRFVNAGVSGESTAQMLSPGETVRNLHLTVTGQSLLAATVAMALAPT